MFTSLALTAVAGLLGLILIQLIYMHARPTRIPYERRVIQVNRRQLSFTLKELVGKRGFEMVETITEEWGLRYTLILKRPMNGYPPTWTTQGVLRYRLAKTLSRLGAPRSMMFA